MSNPIEIIFTDGTKIEVDLDAMLAEQKLLDEAADDFLASPEGQRLIAGMGGV